MNLSPWIQSHYLIQFPIVAEIGLHMEPIGVIDRAWGLSVGAYALLPPVNPLRLKEKFIPLTEQTEQTMLRTLDDIQNPSVSLAEVFDAANYPIFIMRVAIAGQEVTFSVMMNTRRTAPLVYERFIAFLVENEVETYQQERASRLD